MGEPYVLQEAHQRFLIEARLFLGKNCPSSSALYSSFRRAPRKAAQSVESDASAGALGARPGALATTPMRRQEPIGVRLELRLRPLSQLSLSWQHMADLSGVGRSVMSPQRNLPRNASGESWVLKPRNSCVVYNSLSSKNCLQKRAACVISSKAKRANAHGAPPACPARVHPYAV